MITGYGAKELKDPLMNLNGKKNKSGWYKTEQYKKSGEKDFKTTTHKESVLYKTIQLLREENHGFEFENLTISDSEDGSLVPLDNCVLLKKIVKQLTTYIRKCIKKVTNDGFGEVKKQLEYLYQDIDYTGGISLSKLGTSTKRSDKIHKIEDLLKNLKNLKGTELEDILKENNLQVPKKKYEKINEIKAHLIDKKKNLLYFSWRVSPEASLVRNLRWDVSEDRDTPKLPQQLLPTDYINPSREEIIQFILDNSDSRMKEMLERLNNYHEEIRQEEIKSKKGSSKSGYLSKKLNKQINICLRTIASPSNTKEVQKTAHYHLIKRWANKSSSGALTVNAGKRLSFSKPTIKTIQFLDGVPKDVIRGLVPNFIHSFDAMHMQMIIQELSKNEVNHIWAVHDSFGVHACHVEKMRDIVKNTFVELHKDPLNIHIENIRKLNSNILKNNDCTDSDEKTEVEDSDDSQNNQGFFSIKDVLNSKYMIS